MASAIRRVKGRPVDGSLSVSWLSAGKHSAPSRNSVYAVLACAFEVVKTKQLQLHLERGVWWYKAIALPHMQAQLYQLLPGFTLLRIISLESGCSTVQFLLALSPHMPTGIAA